MLTFSTSALAASGAVTWGGGGVGVGAREVGEFAGCRVIVDSQVNIVRPDHHWQPSGVPLLHDEVRHHP